MGAKPRIDRTGKGRDRMWLRFAGLAVGCAVLPGFGLAAAMTGVLAAGQPAGWWYPAAVQAHATALLMGWGVAMILGVAQHFLPRLRGVKLAHPTWVPPLFWLFAIGLVVRVCGQPLLGWCETGGHREWREPLRVAIAAGVLAQAIGVVGLVAVLAVTFRSGPPLAKNKGFQQIAPLLAVAASALCLAQVAWCVAAVRQFVSGASLAVLSPGWQWLAVDLVLFGFIAAVSVAMSSRLFPLTFRTQLPHAGGLVVAAGLFAAHCVLVAGIASRVGSAGVFCRIDMRDFFRADFSSAQTRCGDVGRSGGDRSSNFVCLGGSSRGIPRVIFPAAGRDGATGAVCESKPCPSCDGRRFHDLADPFRRLENVAGLWWWSAAWTRRVVGRGGVGKCRHVVADFTRACTELCGRVDAVVCRRRGMRGDSVICRGALVESPQRGGGCQRAAAQFTALMSNCLYAAWSWAEAS